MKKFEEVYPDLCAELKDVFNNSEKYASDYRRDVLNAFNEAEIKYMSGEQLNKYGSFNYYRECDRGRYYDVYFNTTSKYKVWEIDVSREYTAYNLLWVEPANQDTNFESVINELNDKIIELKNKIKKLEIKNHLPQTLKL